MKNSKLKFEKLESGSYKTVDNRFWVRDTYCPIGEITEIKSTTFVVEGNEYSRLTGEGDKANYGLPDNEVADHVMSDRVIKDFCLRPSAYNLTAEQKLAIAKILRG